MFVDANSEPIMYLKGMFGFCMVALAVKLFKFIVRAFRMAKHVNIAVIPPPYTIRSDSVVPQHRTTSHPAEITEKSAGLLNRETQIFYPLTVNIIVWRKTQVITNLLVFRSCVHNVQKRAAM